MPTELFPGRSKKANGLEKRIRHKAGVGIQKKQIAGAAQPRTLVASLRKTFVPFITEQYQGQAHTFKISQRRVAGGVIDNDNFAEVEGSSIQFRD